MGWVLAGIALVVTGWLLTRTTLTQLRDAGIAIVVGFLIHAVATRKGKTA
jgi:hypothetical protein